MDWEKGYVRVTTGSCPLWAWHTVGAYHLGDERKSLPLLAATSRDGGHTEVQVWGHEHRSSLFTGYLVCAKLLGQCRCDFPWVLTVWGWEEPTHYRVALHRALMECRG